MSVSYEVLSQDAVDELHKRYMQKIAKKTEAVLKQHPNCAYIGDLIQQTLLTCDRKRQPEMTEENWNYYLASAESQRELREYVEGKRKLYEEFPEYTSEKLEKAAAQRQDEPDVQNFFAGKDRVYIRFEYAGKSNAENEVREVLSGKGYHLTDYKKGYATDDRGKQQYRIGKLLADHPQLLEKFQSDPSRSGKMLAVLSRKTDDIVYMSTNRAWTSCMGADSFCPSLCDNHLPLEVSNGSLIAYLVSENDPEINNPLGRILIKPFEPAGLAAAFAKAAKYVRKLISNKVVEVGKLYVPAKAYGLSDESFSELVASIVNDGLNKGKEGLYALPKSHYADNLSSRIRKKKGKIEPVY